jgi:lipase chaperone LimK
MNSLFDSKLAIGAASIGAMALGVAGAVLYVQRANLPHTAPEPAQVARAWDAPVGPGQLPGAVSEPPVPDLDLPQAHAPQLALDRGGHLVPDLALRTLIDSFLSKAGGAERKQRAPGLRALLKSSLPSPAAAEADRIVTDYLGYLEVEEQLLARERFARADPGGLSPSEVDHLLAWQQQRAQLRQRILGVAVAQAWFETEDSTCAAALEDWRKLREPEDGTQEQDSNELRARRVHGAALEERRNNNAQGCASQIMDGLAGRQP